MVCEEGTEPLPPCSQTSCLVTTLTPNLSIVQLEMSLFQSSHMPISAPGGGHNFRNCGGASIPAEGSVIASSTQ